MADMTLDMDIETVRRLGYRIVDTIAEELAEPTRRPPWSPAQSDETLEAYFGGALPTEGTAPDELLTTLKDFYLPAANNLLHPRWMAYVLSASTPLPGMAEALLNALNLGPIGPAYTRVAISVARWLGEMLGFAPDAAGYMTSGGSWASLMGLAVARVRRAGWDVRLEGLAGHPPLTAYISKEGHSCFDKSMELLGMGRNQLRKIPVDSNYRIQLEALEESIKADRSAGLQPFCIIGTAGTVNTGAVDPLNAIAKIASQHDLWFHVDGAYGAFATLVPEARPLFSGIEQANSLAVDPHKWLNVPLGAG